MTDLPALTDGIHTIALVIVPVFSTRNDKGDSAALKIEEAVGLAEAIQLEVCASKEVKLTKIRPATLFGSGKTNEIGALIKEEHVGVTIVDHPLTPIQQRNLELEWHCKVLDRTALILEIFGARARTYEGRLQVELAALQYQRSRLVRSWTHLERQRGGFGFIGGPGESQLEIDRRLTDQRITKLQGEIVNIRKTRTLQRASRQRAAIPTVALVGYTNAGKSTLFNALTKTAAAAAENYPFCTIEPNVGQVPVPDPRLQLIADIAEPKKIVPTLLAFVDIAGLVRGASKGEGLGNQFLGNIREVDAILHVLRCFEDDNVTHVDGRIDPIGDAETVDTELMLSDLESLEKRTQAAIKRERGGDKEAKMQLDLIGRIIEALQDGRPARDVEISKDEAKTFRQLQLLTSKPVLYVCNVDEASAGTGNEYSRLVEEMAQRQSAAVVVISASIEAELAQLDDDEEVRAFLEDLGLSEPGLDRVIRAGYDLLGLLTYFTAGPQEVRAWTITDGTLAPGAAGVIHGDFERGFIRAETIAYEDFLSCKGEQGAKDAGRMRSEGRDYRVQDADILLFRFNV